MDIRQAVLDSFEELGWTEWPDDNLRVAELVEEKFTSTKSARDAITPLLVRAVTTDGCHHKQWYLEAIAEAFQIELPPHDIGIAP